MEKIILESIDHLHLILQKYSRLPHTKYRGQSNEKWPLIPKAGREAFRKIHDSMLFLHWKRRAVGILNKSFSGDIEYLTVAQHTGLPTRLLDWSHSPLVALFFAVNENLELDGAVYFYRTLEKEIDRLNIQNPFNPSLEYYFHLPSSSINRLDNQFGHFSIHKDPCKDFQKICISKNLTKLIIPFQLKHEILLMLNHYGVNFLTIYPDLEGLSKHISWFYENFDLWGDKSPI